MSFDFISQMDTPFFLGRPTYNAVHSGQDDKPAAPPSVVAPTLDPNAGVGSGYGGELPSEYQAALDAYLAKNPGMAKYIEDTRKAAASARASGNTAEADRLDAAVTKMTGIAQDTGNKYYGPDMSDPARFAKQAFESYKRPAPQATIVTPDRTQVTRDLATEAGARNDLNAGITGMQDLETRLKSDLAGNAPSLAQAQLAQTTDQNIAAQRSMAATAGPMDYAATARAAVMAGANTQQQAVGQQAMLRAQEYAASEGLLGKTTQDIVQAQITKRAGDLQALGYSYQDAIAQARLEADQRQFNTEQQQKTNALNQGREEDYLKAYLDMMHMKQSNAIEQLHAGLTTNATNASAGAANFSTESNNALEKAKRDEQNRRDMQNFVSSGYAAWQTMNKDKPATTNPTAPTLNYQTPPPDWAF